MDCSTGAAPDHTRTRDPDTCGCGRGALEQEGLLAGILGPDLEDHPRQPQPVAGVVGRHRGDLPQDLQSRAEIIAPEGSVRIGLESAGGFIDRPRLALDLGLQLDRGIREIVALEGLIRRVSRNQAKRQRGADGHGANETDHVEAPWGRKIRRGGLKKLRKGDGLMAGKQT